MIHQLCDGIWCKCPTIEEIEKEGMLFYKLNDDFGHSVILTKNDMILVGRFVKFKLEEDSDGR